MNIFKRIAARLRLDYAICRAEAAYAQSHGDCFYVMPGGASGRLVIINRTALRNYRRHGIISRSVTMSDLERDCFYRTAKRLSPLPEDVLRYKRERYFEWVERLGR